MGRNGVERGAAYGDVPRGCKGSGPVESRGREIDCDHLPAVLGQVDGVLSGAAGQIERAGRAVRTRKQR